MGERPGSMYREIKGQAYTRREYIGGVPGLRITQFELGNKHEDFEVTVHLIADEQAQFRHQAIESARVSANRLLVKNCGALGYHIKVRVYPHHVLRHNKQAAGAGADRISSGMRNAFGKPVGSAARVSAGQELFTIRTHWQFWDQAKEALRRAYMKLPTPCSIVTEQEVPVDIEERMKNAKAIGSTDVEELEPTEEEEEEEEELEEEELEGEEVEGEEAEGEEGEGEEDEEQIGEGDAPGAQEHSL